MNSTTHETPSLLKGVEKTLGSSLFKKVASCKVLLVGSGGIGCELLKGLALSGFTNVEVIDLDTIDVSNLNRQFLFRRHHVGKAKCEVACEAVLAMIPSKGNASTYKPQYGNVCDNNRFNVQYISTFDLIFNALDNVPARRRVNRLCLAASVPLIESGTTGYLGQVTVIDKASNVECYECQTKPTQKVYPICTIRSTPSMPVHTIVWAKELYKLCFGPKVEDSMLFEDQAVEDNEKSTYMDFVLELRSLLFDKKCSHNLRDVTGKVLIALYNVEIQKQLDMERFKTARKVPTPIPMDMIVKLVNDENSRAPVPTKRDGYKQTDIFSRENCIEEAISLFLEGAEIIQAGGSILPEFDKDDVFAMRLVTCTSNLRSYVFGIEPIQSYYSTKGIAGNIIPAIATTNAIVAGLQIIQAFHILKKRLETEKGGLKEVCRYTYCLRDKTRKGLYLQPTSLPDPNPKCFVCRNAVINVSLDTEKWTLEMLLRRIIKKELGFMEPSILIGDDIIYEEGEGSDNTGYVVNLPKSLINLPAGGVKHGTVIGIEDFTQDLEVSICVSHKTVWKLKIGEEENAEMDEEEKFTISGDKPSATNEDTSSQESKPLSGERDNNDDDDIEVLPDIQSTSNGKKRSIVIQDTEDDEGPKKRAKV